MYALISPTRTRPKCRYRHESIGARTHTVASQVYFPGLRYYRPEAGRWLNRDPLGERGGAGGDAFVSNGPLSAVGLLGPVRRLSDAFRRERCGLLVLMTHGGSPRAGVFGPGPVMEGLDLTDKVQYRGVTTKFLFPLACYNARWLPSWAPARDTHGTILTDSMPMSRHVIGMPDSLDREVR